MPKGCGFVRDPLLRDFRKDEDSRVGEKLKACRGDSEKKKKSVCAWGSVGEGGGVGKETIIGDI